MIWVYTPNSLTSFGLCPTLTKWLFDLMSMPAARGLTTSIDNFLFMTNTFVRLRVYPWGRTFLIYLFFRSGSQKMSHHTNQQSFSLENELWFFRPDFRWDFAVPLKLKASSKGNYPNKLAVVYNNQIARYSMDFRTTQEEVACFLL